MNKKLQKSIISYSKSNGYQASLFTQITCLCGHKKFNLHSDDEQGSAKYTCGKCNTEIDAHDSMKYAVEVVENVCNCDNDEFEIIEGVAFYEGSREPRWIYIGCYCSKCKLAGVYVDWQVR